ncbi:hypothetical protein WA026_018988 [Henosepilachna vigintioctopunctata]|uniref:Uncharacterized protein n=1 Tax=Henosepilachna vigintioctopunctata TaxID=420089 RepID=A0AAW1VET6_9CUCU
MASKNAKFLYNLLSQELHVKPEINCSRLYSSSKGGKDPCKPKDPCPKKKDKCHEEDYSNQKDPCGPKSKEPKKDPCHPKKASQSRSPGISKIPTGGIACPPRCCQTSCCAAPPNYPDAGGKLLCSPAEDGNVALIKGGAYGIAYNCAAAILQNRGKVMVMDNRVEPGKKAFCKLINMFAEKKVAFV